MERASCRAHSRPPRAMSMEAPRKGKGGGREKTPEPPRPYIADLCFPVPLRLFPAAPKGKAKTPAELLQETPVFPIQIANSGYKKGIFGFREKEKKGGEKQEVVSRKRGPITPGNLFGHYRSPRTTCFEEKGKKKKRKRKKENQSGPRKDRRSGPGLRLRFSPLQWTAMGRKKGGKEKNNSESSSLSN